MEQAIKTTFIVDTFKIFMDAYQKTLGIPGMDCLLKSLSATIITTWYLKNLDSALLLTFIRMEMWKSGCARETIVCIGSSFLSILLI